MEKQALIQTVAVKQTNAQSNGRFSGKQTKKKEKEKKDLQLKRHRKALQRYFPQEVRSKTF